MFELLEIYHEALTADLATLGMDVDYPLEQLHEDMKDRAMFGLVAIAQILPIIVAPPSEVFDLDNFTPEDVSADDHPLMTNYKNSYYQATAGSFLEHMETIGYLAEAGERLQPIVDELRAKKAEEADGEGDWQEARATSARITSAQHRRVLNRLRSTVWRVISQPMCEE